MNIYPVFGVEYLSTPVASVDPVVGSPIPVGSWSCTTEEEKGGGETARILKNDSYIDVRPNPPLSLAWIVADM